MLILCLELVRGRLGVMSADIRKLFFFILTTLIEKSPVSKWITGTLAVLFNRGCSQVHNILITVMTHIVVDKSTDNAKSHSICFLPQYQSQRKGFFQSVTKFVTQRKSKRCI